MNRDAPRDSLGDLPSSRAVSGFLDDLRSLTPAGLAELKEWRLDARLLSNVLSRCGEPLL